MSFRSHHTCGMMKSPLECLRSQFNGFTQVVTLDSWTSESLKPNSDTFWAHLLIEAWVALEGERESLGLGEVKPTIEALMGQIQFHRPKVGTNLGFT